MLYILLPVHNRRHTTERFIKCLKEQSFPDYRLVLIDDGSEDGTAQMVQAEISRTTVLRGKGNWWWAGSLQKGFDWIRSSSVRHDDVVLLINDDLEFESDFLEQGVNLAQAQERTIVFAQAFSKQTGSLFWSGIQADWATLSFRQAESLKHVNCVSTRGLFLKVGDLLEIGGFHPMMLPHYGSDYEFAIRAHRMGFHFLTDTSLRLTIDEETSGYRSFEGDDILTFVRKFFSRKNPSNPVFWSTFILLSCPWRYKMSNIVKVWRGALHLIAKRALGSL